MERLWGRSEVLCAQLPFRSALKTQFVPGLVRVGIGVGRIISCWWGFGDGLVGIVDIGRRSGIARGLSSFSKSESKLDE